MHKAPRDRHAYMPTTVPDIAPSNQMNAEVNKKSAMQGTKIIIIDYVHAFFGPVTCAKCW